MRLSLAGRPHRAASARRCADVLYLAGDEPHLLSFSKPPPHLTREYMKLFRPSTEQKDFSIPGGNGAVAVRMIAPAGSPNAPIVVLVHGLAPTGNKDALLNVLAVRMVQIGLRVVIPTLRANKGD